MSEPEFYMGALTGFAICILMVILLSPPKRDACREYNATSISGVCIKNTAIVELH